MPNPEMIHYEIKSAKLPESFDGTCIVFISDLHEACFGTGNRILLEKIHEIRPDYIMTSGDLVTAGRELSGEAALSLLLKLVASYEVYYANGNHEKKRLVDPETRDRFTSEYYNKASQAGVHFLNNQSIWLKRKENRIRLTGLDLDLEYYKKLWHCINLEQNDLEKMLGAGRVPEFSILLAHNPKYFIQYAQWGADLVLSGHVHGGILVFPGVGGLISPDFHLFPKYDSGLFKEKSAQMVLSRGLGMHTIKIRFRNKPELSVIHLKRQMIERNGTC